MVPFKSAVAALVLIPALAQAQGVTRQSLQTTEFPANFTTVTAIATIAAGACAGLHTHPGLETSYVLDGEITLKIDGKPDQKLKMGDSFQIPINGKHDACNAAATPAKVLGTYVVEKGKPLASPAQ
jgi:quercetin dioxygenase-like cupin family protein